MTNNKLYYFSCLWNSLSLTIIARILPQQLSVWFFPVHFEYGFETEILNCICPSTAVAPQRANKGQTSGVPRSSMALQTPYRSASSVVDRNNPRRRHMPHSSLPLPVRVWGYCDFVRCGRHAACQYIGITKNNRWRYPTVLYVTFSNQPSLFIAANFIFYFLYADLRSLRLSTSL